MVHTAHELTILGERIEQARFLTSSLVSPAPLREWLQEASALSRTQSQTSTPAGLFAIWGTLLGYLFRQEKNPPENVDASYLADFLNAACNVQGGLMQIKSQFGAIDDPAHYERTPQYVVYDSLTFVTGTLSSDRVQPLLARVLERGEWEPYKLLALLQITLPMQQSTYLNPPRGHRSPQLKETAFGEVLLALQKTWTISLWRPSHNPQSDRSVYAALWEMYPYDMLSSPHENELHAQRLLATRREFPEHGLEALQFLHKNNFVDKRILDAVFPIRFELCDPALSVKTMISMLEFSGKLTTGTSLLQQAFEKYHPDLNGLLQMHFAMHDRDPTADSAYLVEPWIAICKCLPLTGLHPSVDNIGTLLEE